MTAEDKGVRSPAQASPFDPSPSARTRFVRGGVLALLLGGALVATWWFTRSTPVDAAIEGHDHAATPAEASARQPVMLSAEAARRIGVTYATAERGPLVAEVRTVGLVTFDETRVKTIAPKVEGYVEELFVDFTGQAVEANAPLLRLYSPALVTAQEELLLARKLAADVANGGASAVRDAESLVASARRRLQYWDIPESEIARVEATGEVTKTLTLRSPVSGVVVEKNVLGGQRIMAGDALYRVADLREVWVEGEVFERDLPAVRLGQQVAVDIDALPGQPRTGRIVFVSPILSPETRTAKVRVALRNTDLALKPGMYATLRVQVAAAASVVHVPRSALLATGTRTLVFVREADGMLHAREVEPGVTAGDRVAIRRGLVAGDVVVSSATFLIDAESNLGAAIAAMANMPGMADVPSTTRTP